MIKATSPHESTIASVHQHQYTRQYTVMQDRQRSKIQSRKIVIRMLISVVIAFFVCWAPFHAQRLLFLYVTLYGSWTEVLRKVNQDLFSLAGYFYYSNSTINPILYSVMSNRFRVAFREKLCAGNPCTGVFCCFCCCWKWVQDQMLKYRTSSSADSNPQSSSSKPIVANRPHYSNFNHSSNKALQEYVKTVKKDDCNAHYINNGLKVIEHLELVRDVNFKEANSSCISHSKNDINSVSNKSTNHDKSNSIAELEEELAVVIQCEVAKLHKEGETCCSNCNGLFNSKSKHSQYSPLLIPKPSSSGKSSNECESKL